MEKFLRTWRQEALNKHQYESAIFIGDKLLALTNSDKDAFWLAQVHFSTGNYTRAQSFLSKLDLISTNASCKYLAAHCLIKLGKFTDALEILGDKNPIHLIVSGRSGRKKPQIASTNRRALTVGKGCRDVDREKYTDDRECDEGTNIRFEAAMCYLRGLCYAKQNAFDKAKECYKNAVQIDVQCFEAFDQLMKKSFLTPDEEWSFLASLNFDSIRVGDDPSLSQEAAEFTKMLYITRMSKYNHAKEFSSSLETLSTHYRLSDNSDMLLAKAELLFIKCRFREALKITEKILSKDRYNIATLPVHLACLHELNEKNTLFLLAHELADNHPEEPTSWLAIGVYYLTINQISEARRFFSKASLMDPHFGPAWIGFAHTFAADGEHDQAISAYSTAARLFQGTHLPSLFLGMQNLQLNNLSLAQEYLNTAYETCKTDPLLLNEMGVVYYHQDEIENAINLFEEALKLAEEIQSDPQAWISTRANLGHAFRRVGRLNEALAQFDEVLRRGGRSAGIFAAKGLILLEMGFTFKAIVTLHEALAINPQDAIATELLNKALTLNETIEMMDDVEEERFDQTIQMNKQLVHMPKLSATMGSRPRV